MPPDAPRPAGWHREIVRRQRLLEADERRLWLPLLLIAILVVVLILKG